MKILKKSIISKNDMNGELFMAMVKNSNTTQMSSYEFSEKISMKVDFFKNDLKFVLSKSKTNQILAELLSLGRAYRKLHFCKLDGGKFYNTALDPDNSGLCDKDGNLDSLFLNMILTWEEKIKTSYSELFKLTNGNRSVKFYKKDNKAMYMEDLLDMYDEISSIPYMGEICGKIYGEADKLFSCDYNEIEFVKAEESYNPLWVSNLDKLDKVLADISRYMSWNDVVCEVVDIEFEYSEQKLAI